MANYDYDLFVIGGGSGGVRGARMAAATGARVGLAEEDRYGGTCVIRGCVPKKLLVYAAHFKEDFEDAAGYGWDVAEPRFDWPKLIANKDKEINRLEGVYKKLLADAGVEAIDGRATFVDPNTLDVAGRRITAEKILVAAGGHASVPDIPGNELGFTSNEAFHLDRLPERIVILGGGYIAVEFAGIFNGLGSQVTQVYRRDPILRGFDGDVRRTLQDELRKKGIDLRTGVNIEALSRNAAGAIDVRLTDGTALEADAVMFATGRAPNTSKLGLDAAGVECGEDGAIAVDAFSRTSQPHIFAIGDITNRLNLTPVAIEEAMAFVDTAFKGKERALDHRNVPHAVFSQPPVSVVGMTQEEAEKAGHVLEIYRSSFRPMKHTLSGREEKTMMKLVVDASSRRVLGAHMVGLDAPEIIQGVGIAVKMGASKEDFDATVGIHPTAAEEFVTMREPVSTAGKKAAE
ncbi:MAG: glutathione-disulfide reductase [Rhodovibrionaceae bacterium]|nr:glutathione-disulfide reductase [Rhodovibrionaceae bacterium]